MKRLTSIGLFSGAGGLDLGFESAGFEHLYSSDLDPFAIETLQRNRPHWRTEVADAKLLDLTGLKSDVVLAGFPCQGFSLGGHRKIEDQRNQLYLHAIRLVDQIKPRLVVFENVLNMRTMSFNGKESAADTIANNLEKIGYETIYCSMKVSEFGVPQTRRRFIFIGFKDGIQANFNFPRPDKFQSLIKDHLYDLVLASAVGEKIYVPNHDVSWGFNTKSHYERKGDCSAVNPEDISIVRLSRTASDGNPVREWDAPMPALDTGTIWGVAAGGVEAIRFMPDRSRRSNVRNINSTAKLWKISADHLRRLTIRELARIQTFPDDWVFGGSSVSVMQRQIGNAVPCKFAEKIASSLKNYLDHIDLGVPLISDHNTNAHLGNQLNLSLDYR